MNYPPPMKYVLTHLWGTLTCPIQPYGAHSDPKYMLSLGPASCSSFPSGHIRVLAPPGGPLSVCSGSAFLYPWNQTSGAVSSGIKWILKMACVIAVSSRQTKFTTKPSDVVLIGRGMEKNGEDKLAFISAESLSLLLHPPIHFQTIMEWYDCEIMS